MAIRFAKRGYKVSAVDLSREMLEIAQAKAVAAGVAIEFHQGNMKDFNNQQQYDVIINLHDGLNYLLDESDIQRFMDNTLSLLKSGGVLLFDVVTPLLCQRHFRGYREIYSDENGGYERFTRFDAQTQLAESVFTLSTADENTVEVETHLQKAYTLEAVEEFCKLSAYDWWQILDDETLEAADGESERLWVLLRKS